MNSDTTGRQPPLESAAAAGERSRGGRRQVVSETAGFGPVQQTGPSRDVDQRLTVAEAAREVRCSDDTIRRGYWSGHLEVERLGVRLQGVRIRRSALNRWLAKGARTA